MGAREGSWSAIRERSRWRLAEMRRLSLVSYLMSCTFSCLSDLPRARGAARWPGPGAVRAGGGGRPRAPARVRPAPCSLGALRTTICVSLQSGAWRRAGRGRGRRRPEALPVNVLPGVSSLVAHCPPRQQTHARHSSHDSRDVSHMRSDSWSCTPQNDTHTHAHSERWR